MITICNHATETQHVRDLHSHNQLGLINTTNFLTAHSPPLTIENLTHSAAQKPFDFILAVQSEQCDKHGRDAHAQQRKFVQPVPLTPNPIVRYYY